MRARLEPTLSPCARLQQLLQQLVHLCVHLRAHVRVGLLPVKPSGCRKLSAQPATSSPTKWLTCSPAKGGADIDKSIHEDNCTVRFLSSHTVCLRRVERRAVSVWARYIAKFNGIWPTRYSLDNKGDFPHRDTSIDSHKKPHKPNIEGCCVICWVIENLEF